MPVPGSCYRIGVSEMLGFFWSKGKNNPFKEPFGCCGGRACVYIFRIDWGSQHSHMELRRV